MSNFSFSAKLDSIQSKEFGTSKKHFDKTFETPKMHSYLALTYSNLSSFLSFKFKGASKSPLQQPALSFHYIELRKLSTFPDTNAGTDHHTSGHLTG